MRVVDSKEFFVQALRVSIFVWKVFFEVVVKELDEVVWEGKGEVRRGRDRFGEVFERPACNVSCARLRWRSTTHPEDMLARGIDVWVDVEDGDPARSRGRSGVDGD